MFEKKFSIFISIVFLKKKWLAEHAALGVNITPLLTPEPMVGEEQARRRSKALDVKILMSS